MNDLGGRDGRKPLIRSVHQPAGTGIFRYAHDVATAKDFAIRCAVFALGVLMLGLAPFIDLAAPVAVVWLLLGAFIVLMALFYDRVMTFGFSHGTTSITAELSKVVGLVVAQELDETGIARRVDAYAFVHETLGTDRAYRDAKVKLQDTLVEDVRARSFAVLPDRDAVSKLASGSPAERVLALGFLRGNATLVTIEALKSSICGSLSGNEQYHALVAARDSWAQFDAADRAALLEIVRTRPYADEDPDRDAVAAEILALGKP